MCRVAEARLTYLNEMLQNSEFYLMHDKKQEEAERELRLERERVAEEQRQRELQEAQIRREDELRKRKEATEAFYQNQMVLEGYELNLAKPIKAKGRKTADGALEGEDLGAEGQGADYEPMQDDRLD